MLIALFLSAFAQQEACEPKPASALTESLDAIVPLLGTDPKAAARELAKAEGIARCLDAPIAPAQLARYAWLQAEGAALRQDEVFTWAWAEAAHDAGSPQPPERVPAFHPLRMLLEEAPEPHPLGGPEDVGLAAPRKGTIYVDGVAITAPRVRMETPHLVQVFGKDGLILSMWQNGAAFSPALLQASGDRVRPTADAHDALPPENWKPAKLGTVEAYEKWIDKHPEGPWLQEAKDAIDEMAWNAARETDTDLAYRQYVHDFPEGLHVRQASLLVEHAAYLEVMKRPSREKWEGFLERYQEGTYANEARMQIDTIDWRVAQRANTPEAFRAFIDQHPESPNRQRALDREERRFFERAAQVLSSTGLKAYLERWPNGRFVAEAKALSGGVEITQATVTVDGQLDASAQTAIREKLLEVLEERKLPVVEADGPDTGRLHVVARSAPDGAYLRVKADVALEYGTLQYPLIAIKIDTPVVKDAALGATLAEMLAESLPPFEIWHHPPEDEEGEAKKAEGKKKP